MPTKKAAQLPSGELIPAAQYIRMSTEHQRYSPDNQKAAIASFADARGYEVVKTYLDAGKSGLTLRARAGLKQLLSDVLSGDIAFKAILVLDVSRWGRFQDADQAAHYEYLCREAGVMLHYCAEPFENNGDAMSSIVKHMKRVMAAEYSRELSVKVSRALRQQARLGFKMGGAVPYGLRRQVVDEHGKPRMLLKRGQIKALSTDKVLFALGPPSEVDVIKRIFHDFVIGRKRTSSIAKWLNQEKRKHPTAKIWSPYLVRGVIRNEIYAGTYIFGRTLANLGHPTAIDEKDWIRVAVVEPIISEKLFQAAGRRMQRNRKTRTTFTTAQLIRGMARLLKEKGRLSCDLVTDCPYLPAPTTISLRFGSMEAAYRTVGYIPELRFRTRPERAFFSDEQVFDHLRRIFRERGQLRGRYLDEDRCGPSRSTLSARFGGLRNAMQLAGLSPTPHKWPSVAEIKEPQQAFDYRKTRRKVARTRNADGSLKTNAQIVTALKIILSEKGYLSRPVIDADERAPLADTISERFDGILNAYGEAGYYSTYDEVNEASNARTWGTWVSPFLGN